MTQTESRHIGQKYFQTVLEAMSSLLNYGTLPDHAEFITTVAGGSPGLAILTIVFTFLAPLTVMGMLAGVLVEVISVVSSVEKEIMVVEFVGEQLHELLDIE